MSAPSECFRCYKHKSLYILENQLLVTPVVRSTNTNILIPDSTESYKYGDKMTHGYYEYGASVEWFKGGKGEVYMNWQMLHTGDAPMRKSINSLNLISNTASVKFSK